MLTVAVKEICVPHQIWWAIRAATEKFLWKLFLQWADEEGKNIVDPNPKFIIILIRYIHIIPILHSFIVHIKHQNVLIIFILFFSMMEVARSLYLTYQCPSRIPNIYKEGRKLYDDNTIPRDETICHSTRIILQDYLIKNMPIINLTFPVTKEIDRRYGLTLTGCNKCNQYCPTAVESEEHSDFKYIHSICPHCKQ